MLPQPRPGIGRRLAGAANAYGGLLMDDCRLATVNDKLTLGGTSMTKFLTVLGVLILLAVVLFSSYVGRRNQMVRKNETINAAWSQVDVVLQRRADLIPNL